jgi:signal transduction histidine kinase
LSEGRVLGVLGVESSTEDAFSEAHEEIVGIFAAQAAKAIEAGRLFQTVRQERDFRERILGGTPNGVVALDPARRILWFNDAARRLLALDEGFGNPIERYLPHPEFLESLRRVLGGEDALSAREMSLGAGLDARHLEVKVFPTGQGELGGAALILQDVTDRRRLDAQLDRMGRLASIGQLAAGVAHEIRNPLTGLGISIDILGEEEGLSASGRALLGDMAREIDRLEALIRGLLDFARPQPVRPRPMRVAKALEWQGTFREQCRKKGVRFDAELRGNPKLRGDPEKLKQLFLNLAINALEATEPGGEIRICCDQVRLKGTAWVRVMVEDTGPGMDPEVLAQVFNPFFTTKSEGTGLGLAIAHSIVEQHGGRIDARSEPGAGTRFIVDLPALEGRE